MKIRHSKHHEFNHFDVIIFEHIILKICIRLFDCFDVHFCWYEDTYDKCRRYGFMELNDE